MHGPVQRELAERAGHHNVTVAAQESLIEPTSPGPDAASMLTSPGAHVALMLTSPGPDAAPMLTSPGAHVALMLTSPGPDAAPMLTSRGPYVTTYQLAVAW